MAKDSQLRSKGGVKGESDFTLQAIGEKVSQAGWFEWLIGLALALGESGSAPV